MKFGRYAFCTVLLISGCGGGGGSENLPAAVAPAVFDANEGVFLSNLSELQQISVLAPSVTPLPISGSGTYEGQFAVNLTGSLDANVVGDLAFTARFSDGNVSGSGTNLVSLNLADGGAQRLGGELLIDGSVDSSAMLTADMQGEIEFRAGDDETLVADVDFDMQGRFFNSSTGNSPVVQPPSFITGQVFGGTTGANGVDLLIIGGSFLAEEIDTDTPVIDR